MKKWLFIDTGLNDPFFNMEFDKKLLSYYKVKKTPILRLYFWKPFGITVGVNQNIDSGINTEYCRKNGIDIVRRITGGEAIYHGHEITYSLVCSSYDLCDDEGSWIKVKESYKRLTEFIVLFYSELGLECERASDFYGQNFKPQISPLCFSGLQESDILIGGKKIGGNAQKRERDTIFQHGSIPLTLEHCLLEKTFGICVKRDFMTDLFSQIGFNVDVNHLKNILKQKFQDSLNCCLQEVTSI